MQSLIAFIVGLFFSLSAVFAAETLPAREGTLSELNHDEEVQRLQQYDYKSFLSGTVVGFTLATTAYLATTASTVFDEDDDNHKTPKESLHFKAVEDEVDTEISTTFLTPDHFCEREHPWTVGQGFAIAEEEKLSYLGEKGVVFYIDALNKRGDGYHYSCATRKQIRKLLENKRFDILPLWTKSSDGKSFECIKGLHLPVEDFSPAGVLFVVRERK